MFWVCDDDDDDFVNNRSLVVESLVFAELGAGFQFKIGTNPSPHLGHFVLKADLVDAQPESISSSLTVLRQLGQVFIPSTTILFSETKEWIQLTIRPELGSFA